MRARFLFPLLVLVTCSAPGSAGWTSWAAEGGSGAPSISETQRRFRWVYAPADRIEDWPRDDVGLLPVSRDEFDRLLATAGTPLPAGRDSVAAAIVSAEYYARLEGATLVDGTADLELSHSSPKPTTIALEPFALAVRSAQWLGDQPRSAKLGVGPDGKTTVVVDQPGTLDVQWSLVGSEDFKRSLRFAFELPQCAANRLILDVPEDMVPQASCAAVVTELSEKPENGCQRWRLDLGAHHRFVLSVVPRDRIEWGRRSARVRQTTVYDFALDGVRVFSELEIDSLDEPLDHVVLVLDPGLQMVGAEHRDSDLLWTAVSPAADKGAAQVVLELPEEIQGIGRTVRVEAEARLLTGQRARLPTLRPVGMFWEEGEVSLWVPSSLVVAQMAPISARQLRTAPLPAPRTGKNIQFQEFAPDAGVEIMLTRSEKPPSVDYGVSLELGAAEMVARVAAKFHVQDQERFDLTAELAPNWTVESVEADSIADATDVLGDWSIEEEDGRPPRLVVRLAKSLAPSRPVWLTTRLRRRQVSSRREHTISQLAPLRFLNAEAGRRLIAVQAAEPYELRLSETKGLRRFAPDSLDAAALDLFGEPPGELVFEYDAGARGLRISLARKQPRYAVTVRARATVRRGWLTESYHLHCVPESAPVTHLLVRFSQTRAVPIRCTFGSDPKNRLTARRLTPEENGPAQPDTELDESGETWEIKLPEPQSAPFRILARRAVTCRDEEPVSLVHLPEAGSAQATLDIGSVDGTPIQIRASRLTPIRSKEIAVDQYDNGLASFRYDVRQDADAVAEPAAVILSQPTRQAPWGWVWSARLESRCEPRGTGHHLATYRVENAGREKMRFTMPNSSDAQQVAGVWVDGSRATWQGESADGTHRLTVDLPADRRFVVVAIGFRTEDEPWGLVMSSVMPGLPEPDVPVLARHWTAWLPPGFKSHCAFSQDAPRPGRRLTWSERLFGPLGRPADATVFDPISEEDWTGLLGSSPERSRAATRATQFLDRLGERARRVPSGEAAGNLDWGTLLSDEGVTALFDDAPGEEDAFVLLVDRPALNRIGLTPQSAIPPVRGKPQTAHAITLLKQAGLALLLHRSAIAITTAGETAMEHEQVAPVAHGVVWQTRPGPLADEIAAAATGSSSNFATIRSWRQTAWESPLPWVTLDEELSWPLTTPDWTARHVELPAASGPPRILVFREHAIVALAWAAFVVVIALAAWLAIDRPAALLAVAAVAGVACLLVPQVYSPIAAGALWGVLFVLAYRLVRRRSASSRDEEIPDTSESSAASRAIQLAVLILSVSIALARAGAARSGEPAPAPRADRSPIHRVYVPVDDARQPVGDQVHVPRNLLEELLRVEAARLREPKGWLLGQARYRGVLSRDPMTGSVELEQLKASLALEVFNPDTRVEIPFRSGDPGQPPGAVTLDGRDIQFQWEAADGTLAFAVMEPRRYELALTLEPAVRTVEGGPSGFDVAVPPLVTSRLELTVPADLPEIDVPSAVGQAVRSPDGTSVKVQLGAAERISVSWSEGAGANVSGPSWEAEELLLMKVQPGVLLDARFKLLATGVKTNRIRLAFDPRLRLQPSGDANLRIETVTRTNGEPQVIEIELLDPTGDQVVVDLKFLLTGVSGIGNVRPPYLDILDARVTRRWIGVWVDPALTIASKPENVEEVDTALFVTAWGDLESPPVLAASLDSAEPQWHLSIAPPELDVASDETLVLNFGAGGAEVNFDAEMEIRSGFASQYQVEVPRRMEIEEISVREGETERVSYWWRDSGKIVHVFFTEPIAGPHQLAIAGRLPVRLRQKSALPVIRVLQSREAKCSFGVFRQESVEVDVSDLVGLSETEPPALEEHLTSPRRLVKWLATDQPDGIEAKVTVRPNRPEVVAHQITLLRHDGQSWMAEVHLRIQTQHGIVDELVLEVPPQWKGPYTTDAAATVQVVQEPDEAPGQLILRPRQAITKEAGQSRLAVSGPVSVAPGAEFSVPHMVLRGVDVAQHTVVVPARIEAGLLAWDTQGLEDAEVPEEFELLPASRENLVAYRWFGGPFQATLRRSSSPSEIYLADYCVDWENDGTFHGVATFDMTAPDISDCSIRLAADHRLVHVRVDGRSAVPQPNGKNCWEVALGPKGYPHRLEVLYSGTRALSATSAPSSIEAPTIDGLSIRKTLWTVSAPSTYQCTSVADASTSNPLEHELARMRNLAALVDLAVEATGEQTEETRQWYRQWIRHWAVARAAVRKQILLTDDPDTREDALADFEALDQAQVQVAESLGLATGLAERLRERAPTHQPADVWLGTLDRRRTLTWAVAGTGRSSISPVYQSIKTDGFAPRLLAAVGLAVAALAAIAAVVGGLWLQLFERWPHLLGIALGLAWWLWLWPSALGWVIVLAVLFTFLRPPWKSLRPSPSTVITVSYGKR